MFYLQVHLIKSEDYYSSPLTILNKLFTYLNIDTSGTQAMIDKKGRKYHCICVHLGLRITVARIGTLSKIETQNK